MYLITMRTWIKSVADRWGAQYGNNKHAIAKDKQDIREQLEALDLTTATKETVDTIIGNDTWTSLKCDECKNNFEAVVQLGEEPDHDSATVTICVDCLQKALALIQAHN